MQPVVMSKATLESLLEERRRLGLDGRDEVWDGVVHMVPSASRGHIRIQVRLVNALTPIAQRRGLEVFIDFDMMDPAKGEQDYRQPDITIVAPENTTKRAVQPGAAVAIEILSPDDEARKKLPFYAKQHVGEVWLIDPRTGTIEVYAGDKPILPQAGLIRTAALGLELTVVGTSLVIRDGANEVCVDLRDVGP